MSVMVYDVLLTKPCEPAELVRALATVFAVPAAAVDVVEEDADHANWDAPVFATFAERHRDIALSLSITAVDVVQDRPTEPELSARLADQLGSPVLYPADEFRPSAYWIIDRHGQPARARLEPSDERDPSVADELALTIDAVSRPIPSLPELRVSPIPEVIREHRMPTPLRDALVNEAGTASGPAYTELGAWEAFVNRMTAGWPPDNWYPAAYYAEDLSYRDEIDQAAKELPPSQVEAINAVLRLIDEAYDQATISDDGIALGAALGLTATEVSERGPRWGRRPAKLPWHA